MLKVIKEGLLRYVKVVVEDFLIETVISSLVLIISREIRDRMHSKNLLDKVDDLLIRVDTLIYKRNLDETKKKLEGNLQVSKEVQDAYHKHYDDKSKKVIKPQKNRIINKNLRKDLDKFLSLEDISGQEILKKIELGISQAIELTQPNYRYELVRCFNNLAKGYFDMIKVSNPNALISTGQFLGNSIEHLDDHAGSISKEVGMLSTEVVVNFTKFGSIHYKGKYKMNPFTKMYEDFQTLFSNNDSSEKKETQI